MNRQVGSTRRGFFLKAGALVSAPLAAAGAGTRAAADDALTARLAELEDREAIFELHRRLVRCVNAGDRSALASLFDDPAAADVDFDSSLRRLLTGPDADVEIVAHEAARGTARVRLRCIAETETPIEPSCTLVEMARLQGEGVVRRSEPRVLEHGLVRRDGVWRIARATSRPA